MSLNVFQFFIGAYMVCVISLCVEGVGGRMCVCVCVYERERKY